MNELSLFTGAGGGVLGSLLLGFREIGYVEIEPYCQQIIAARIKDGIYHNAPIFTDVRTFLDSGAADLYRGVTDIVTGGVPCQAFSVAGKRLGEKDPRNMWPETLRVIERVRPEWAFLENVPGLLSSGYFGTILSGLAEIGFDAEWCVLGADDVGAPHRRKRLWILAHAPLRQDHERGGGILERPQPGRKCLDTAVDAGGKTLPHAARARLEGQEPAGINSGEPGLSTKCGWWDADPADMEHSEFDGRSENFSQPDQRTIEGRGEGSGSRTAFARLDRVANGVAYRVDRLKAIGNGQVPLCAALAFSILVCRYEENAGRDEVRA